MESPWGFKDLLEFMFISLHWKNEKEETVEIKVNVSRMYGKKGELSFPWLCMGSCFRELRSLQGGVQMMFGLKFLVHWEKKSVK